MRGFHGIEGDSELAGVLENGLLIERTPWAIEGRFWHLSIAETPGITAAFGEHVVKVDLEGLDLPEEGFVGRRAPASRRRAA